MQQRPNMSQLSQRLPWKSFYYSGTVELKKTSENLPIQPATAVLKEYAGTDLPVVSCRDWRIMPCHFAATIAPQPSHSYTRSKGDKKRWEERPHGDPRVLGICSMSVCICIYIYIMYICRHIAILCKMHMMYIDMKWHEYYVIMCSIRIHVSPDCWLTSVQWASPAPRPRCGVHRVWQPFGWRPRKS